MASCFCYTGTYMNLTALQGTIIGNGVHVLCYSIISAFIFLVASVVIRFYQPRGVKKDNEKLKIRNLLCKHGL